MTTRLLPLLTLCLVLGTGLLRTAQANTPPAATAAEALSGQRAIGQTLFRWYADDVIEGGPFVMKDGVVKVPEGPGLGVTLDPVALKRCHERFLEEGSFPGAKNSAYGDGFRKR